MFLCTVRQALSLVIFLITPLASAQNVQFYEDCNEPIPGFKFYGMKEVGDMFDNAIDMAANALRLLEEAEGLPDTDHRRMRAAYITELILACKPGDERWNKVKGQQPSLFNGFSFEPIF